MPKYAVYCATIGAGTFLGLYSEDQLQPLARRYSDLFTIELTPLEVAEVTEAISGTSGTGAVGSAEKTPSVGATMPPNKGSERKMTT